MNLISRILITYLNLRNCCIGSLLLIAQFSFAQSTNDTTKSIELETVVIESVRAGNKTPVSQSTLSIEQIKSNYVGQEVPVRLGNTPSITWYSDGGHFTGYSYMRLRGIDQTRINYTLNGVPLNEPEDQGVYFSNYPDFFNNVESVQIQRGVGTTSNGTTSYGGSVNFESPGLLKPLSSELQLSYGSYNTWQISPQFSSGLLPSKMAFYGRYSNTGSAGFREHSGTRGQTFFFSAGYFGKKSVTKLTTFSGRSKNEMSYLAVSENDLKSNYRLNYLRDDENDKFQQTMAILEYSRQLSFSSFLMTSLYYNHLDGNYDVYVDSDMLNFAVRSNMGGLIINYHVEKSKLEVDAGIHANLYQRDHFMRIKPDLTTNVYLNAGIKKEASSFIKLLYTKDHLSFFADAQLRTVFFKYEPDENVSLAFDNITWTFLNPKIGFTYTMDKYMAYISLGRNGREPTRNDMFAGYDNIDDSNYDEVGDFKKVKPEYVTDVELGFQLKFSSLKADANLYAMHFKNEIAAIGQLSYIGLPLRKNVPSSYRRGIEFSIELTPLSRLKFNLNANLSKNRIKEYTSDYDNVTYQNVKPLLTPVTIINQSVQYSFTKWFDAQVSTRYISEAYLNNTNNDDLTVDDSFILNASLNFKFLKKHKLAMMANNITNLKYFTSGYVSASEPYYFAMAQRNYYVSMILLF